MELAKWVAVIAMLIDHYGKIVDPSLYLQTHMIGRVAFPLFATIIGMRLSIQPSLAETYLRRLLPWAVMSQPIFVLAGRDWYEGNILFTLVLGVIATILVRHRANRQASLVAGILMLIPMTWFVEFGPLGVAMVPIVMRLAAWHRPAGSMASGPLGIAANFSPTWPPLHLVDAAAILSSAIALASIKIKFRLPRLPTHVFYGFYPIHLLALHLIDIAT